MQKMSDLADLYPGFASEWINTSFGRIFARVGGKGPPLLLLHGFSETNVMWHRVAPQLADQFTLIIADLPGYGWSDMPESHALHMSYSKRAMANATVPVRTRQSTRQITRPARSARLRCWRGGAIPGRRKPPPPRSTSGSSGRPAWSACRWIPDTSSLRRTLMWPPRRCASSLPR